MNGRAQPVRLSAAARGRIRPQLGADLVVLAGFCALLFFFGLGAIGLTGADEPRYAQIAREMLARHDWVVPVLYGQPWLEKPVLYYWEAMLSYSVFGVHDWAARVPSAVNATALVVAVYFFVRRAWRTPLALDAALITASCAFIIGFGRGASTDMPLAATFGIGMMAWLWGWLGAASPQAEQQRGPGIPQSFGGDRLSGSWLPLAVFYAFMGLGTLAKGPVAPFLAGLVIIIFAAIRRAFRVIRYTLWLPGILLFLAVSVPWYVLVQLHTGNFLRFFILEQNLERYRTTVYHHTQPAWYFLMVILLALLPWTVLALTGFVQAAGRWRPGLGTAAGAEPKGVPNVAEADLNLFLLLWGAVPIVFFSFSESKLPGYILPAVPAFALLAAGYLRRKLLAGGPPHRVLVLAHALVVATTIAFVLAAPYLLLRQPPTRAVWTTALGAGLVVFGAVTLSIYRLGLKVLRVITILPLLAALVFLLRVEAPALDDTFSARPVARELARLAPAGTPLAVLGTSRELNYGLAFYRNAPVLHHAGEIPGAYLLIAHDTSLKDLRAYVPGRALARLSAFPKQGLQIYLVSAEQGGNTGFGRLPTP